MPNEKICYTKVLITKILLRNVAHFIAKHSQAMEHFISEKLTVLSWYESTSAQQNAMEKINSDLLFTIPHIITSTKMILKALQHWQNEALLSCNMQVIGRFLYISMLQKPDI